MEDRQRDFEKEVEAMEEVEDRSMPPQTTEQATIANSHPNDQRGTTSDSKDISSRRDISDSTAAFPSLQSSTADLRHGPSAPRDNVDGTQSSTASLPVPAESAGGLAPPPTRPRATTMSTLKSLRTIDADRPTLRKVETRLAQKEAHPWEHWGITLGLPMIVLFDIVVPCIIYYTWYNKQSKIWRNTCDLDFPNQQPCPLVHPEFDKDILGSAIASFGIGELWILLARAYRLFFHTDDCAPLLSRSRWELDATCWVYLVAMVVALVPFVVGSSRVIPELYLYGPSFLMGFLGVLMAITTCHPFKIPIGINSHARGTGLRPFIYYAAEDFVAVDGLQDREFRVRYNERYESNPMFRRFFLYLTLWWLLGVCVYIGCVSAVIWTLAFHYAFGLTLGLLFAYIAIWAGITVLWIKVEMAREHRAYEEGKISA